jgi:Protein of unknown function (DUF2442)
MAIHSEFVEANRRAEVMQATTPRAIAAYYAPEAGRIVIEFSSGSEFRFYPSMAQGLRHATVTDLSDIEVSPSGFGIRFPRLDEDLYIPALLEGFFGPKNWMAAHLGASGGHARSAAKSAASRENGKLGGRPKHRKVAVAGK